MTKVPVWFPLLAFAILVAASIAWIQFSEESFTISPGQWGDDVYFENIAFQLAKNEGVRVDFTDSEFQQPYRDDNADGKNNWILDLEVRGATTSRSPGFPFFAAGVYKTFGRNWTVVRIAQVIVLSLALTLIVVATYRLAGRIAALIALATLAADLFVLRSAGQFMSEALGTVVICGLFLSCLRLSGSPTGDSNNPTFPWLLVGMLFGLGILIRANLNAWLLMIIVVSSAAMFLLAVSGRSWRLLFNRLALFVIGVTVVVSPWWIRNCVVTKGFAPFGTSGSFGLSGGYCDQAYENFGNWNIGITLASQQDSLATPGFFEMSLPEQELKMGQDSSKRAVEWIAANPGKIPKLMLMKGYSHLGFYRRPWWVILANSLLFFGAIIGCYAMRRNFGIWVCIFLALSLIATMLTWPHFGRYSIPIRPLIHMACGIGTVALWRWLLFGGSINFVQSHTETSSGTNAGS